MKEKISKHVSYAEATATKVMLPNIPNSEQLHNIRFLCENVFEPLRAWVGKPIKINSIFRSKEVNRHESIKGSKTSQHLANNNSSAMDIDDTYKHATNNEMFFWIKENLVFDQLIAEKPVKGKISWIHVSYRQGGNRKEVLITTDAKKYMPYKNNESLIY